MLLFDSVARCDDGLAAEKLLAASNILVNRNQIPNDRGSPKRPSGIRLGSTVPTILGYEDEDVRALGSAVCSVLESDNRHSEIVEYLLAKYHFPAADWLMPSCLCQNNKE